MQRILGAMILAVVAPTTLAVPITWELVGVQFFDETAIVGSFVFDADTQEVSAVQVSTQDGGLIFCAAADCDPNVPDPFPPGGSIAGTEYVLGGPSIAANSIGFILDTGDAGLGGTPLLFLQFDAALTNAGGQIGLPDGGSVEFTCNVGDDDCTNTFDVQTVPFRSTVAGGFIRSVPEPATIFLLGAGLLVLGLRSRKHTG